MTLTYHPTSELVAASWIASIPGSPFSTAMIATQAPVQEKWAVNQDGISQFITVRVVGGSPVPVDMEAPLGMPVVEVKSWATRLGSDKPPWFWAAQMCEIIRLAMYSRGLGVFGRALTIQAGGVTYNPANVIRTVMHTEPRRVYGDKRGYAIYQFDMGLTWREVNLSITN